MLGRGGGRLLALGLICAGPELGQLIFSRECARLLYEGVAVSSRDGIIEGIEIVGCACGGGWEYGEASCVKKWCWLVADVGELQSDVVPSCMCWVVCVWMYVAGPWLGTRCSGRNMISGRDDDEAATDDDGVGEDFVLPFGPTRRVRPPKMASSSSSSCFGVRTKGVWSR